jgi:hypothetical protein
MWDFSDDDGEKKWYAFLKLAKMSILMEWGPIMD